VHLKEESFTTEDNTS